MFLIIGWEVTDKQGDKARKTCSNESELDILVLIHAYINVDADSHI